MQETFSEVGDRTVWREPIGTLGKLTVQAYQRAAAVSARLDDIRAAALDARPAVPFAAALRRERVAVIAEVKRNSPSKGAIAPGLDAVVQAVTYVRGGAAAVSVLTESGHFGGSLDDLAAITAVVDVPVIRKDFIVHPVQLWEARAAGASAVLLIVRALAPDLLPRLLETAREARLETLVEVRDLQELDRALTGGAAVVGVNNRNLETLVMDAGTALRIIPRIPASCIAVAESGMRVPADVENAARAGADAVLVGSSISASADPAAEVRDMAAIRRYDGARR